MEEILKYLETIAAIDVAERKITNRKGAASRPLTTGEIQKLNATYDAADAAWHAIPLEMRADLYPPPPRMPEARGNSGQRPE
jgi:hypothetical protein